MHKLLLALTLLVTSVTQASQVKTQGLRYPNMDQEAINNLPHYKSDYYSLQIHKIKRLRNPVLGLNKAALDQYRRANESLLQKNNNMAVNLLKQAALHLDIAQVLLAYCYRYGIGAKCNKAASNLLLDLVTSDKEDKIDMILHLEFLLTKVELGL